MLGCAVCIAIDTVFAVVSWRQLSQKLEFLRIEIDDKFNDSLKDASTSLNGIATRTEKAVPEKLKTMMTRRELHFFNAFPEIKLKSYEGVIRATKLKERARELFHRD